MSLPKVSIITACFNSEEIISAAINSVNKQSYPNIEHIFIDGRSKDGTVSLIRSLSKRSPLIVSEVDLGIYDALNKGISLANGDIIGFVHSDDFLADELAIERVASQFIEDPTLDATYSDLVYVSKSKPGKLVRLWRPGIASKHKLRFGWMPPHPTLYVRKNRYGEVGFFDLSYQISADYDFIVRLFSCENLAVKYVPGTLVAMRIGGESNRNLERLIQKSIEDARIMRKHGLPLALCLILKNVRKLPQFFIQSRLIRRFAGFGGDNNRNS